MNSRKSSIRLELSDDFETKHLKAVNNNEIQKSRFGNKSKSMFFVRHAAIPQHLRIITGFFLLIIFCIDLRDFETILKII